MQSSVARAAGADPGPPGTVRIGAWRKLMMLSDRKAVGCCEIAMASLTPNHSEVVLATLPPNHSEVVLAGISPNHSEAVLAALAS